MLGADTCGYECEACERRGNEEACIRYLKESMADFLLASGMVIVLPCKEGETVYEVRNNTDACAECNNYSSFYGMDAMCDILEGESRDCPRHAERPVCEKQFMEVVEYTPSIDCIFADRAKFGKTIFLTHEEAEAALSKILDISCKHGIQQRKNEIGEEEVYCEVNARWMNVTLGECLGNCESETKAKEGSVHEE